jgi:hypothetical protein
MVDFSMIAELLGAATRLLSAIRFGGKQEYVHETRHRRRLRCEAVRDVLPCAHAITHDV